LQQGSLSVGFLTS